MFADLLKACVTDGRTAAVCCRRHCLLLLLCVQTIADAGFTVTCLQRASEGYMDRWVCRTGDMHGPMYSSFTSCVP
jgi:hypothetical protein